MADPYSAPFIACSKQLNMLSLVTYNFHGLNNDRYMLFELCDDHNTLNIAVQEHWLTDNNLQLLSNIHPDFAGCGISAMSQRLNKCIYRGRPYKGVGFLWRKTLITLLIFNRRMMMVDF